MRPPLRAFAALLALAIVTVVAAPPARADIGVPSWSTGDTWTYTVRGQNYGVSGIGTLTTTVKGIDTVSVGGNSYQTYRVGIALNVSNTNPRFNSGDAWYRTSDLSLVKLVYNITWTIIVEIVVVTTITYSPPFTIQWPASAGKTWSTTSVVTRQDSTGGGWTSSVTLTFIVQAGASVTVPAGTFDTMPIRSTETGGSYTIAYWSSAGNYVRQQAFDSQDHELSSQELTSYRFSPGFLGLPLVVWLLLLLLVIIIVLAIVFRMRRQPRGAQLPPQTQMPPQNYPPR